MKPQKVKNSREESNRLKVQTKELKINEQSKLGLLISGKKYFEMWDIFTSFNKFLKQFIPINKIRNNKEVKPKWMNGEIKDLLEKPK